MSVTNHVFRLASRPTGMPTRNDFDYLEETLPDPGDGEILVKVLYVSLDPAMRGWMNEGRSYVPPIGIGEVFRAIDVGKVLESKNPKFAVGDFVSGLFGVQEYAISDGRGVTPANPALAPLPVYLSVLGMPGMTAYFGLIDVADLKEGDNVVVSGAAGA